MTMFNESLRAFLKPVVGFLDDPDISEVLINGPREVWIERRGKLRRTGASFTEEGLLAAARNMAQYVGRPLSDERPRLDARLPDGSRIHVVLAPIARRGTTISIRKFFAERLTPAQLVQFGSLSEAMARFLEAAIALRINIVVAGGTGSGKTSLLNALASYIAADERILTIEDSAELQLGQPHVVTLEGRPSDRQGKGAVDIGDLLHSALRLRPDRIIVGEVRGGEAFHLLQAMNTGHGGSLTTTHANTATDTLRRLESLCLLSGVDLPLRAVRAQVASAVHLVVCCERLQDGSRKVTHIAEVLPLERGEYRVQDLFVYTQEARGPEGEVLGVHAPTGLVPLLFARLQAAGFPDLDAAFFDPRAQGLPAPGVFAAALGARSQWAKDLRGATDPDARVPEAAVHAGGQHERAPGGERAEDAAAHRSGGAGSARSSSSSASGTPPSPAATTPAPPAAAPAATPAAAATAPAAVEPLVRAAARELDDEPSIQLDPELAAEVQRRLPHESTLITRNPLFEGPAVDASARAGDQETSPGTRNPHRR